MNSKRNSPLFLIV